MKDIFTPLVSRGELDGFFGLFVDNLLQLVLIVVLCQQVCGIPLEFVLGTILPGAALSILLGNVFYAWQAKRLPDATALPYGINTVSLIAYVFFVIAPVYRSHGDWQLAWRMGLLACLGSGIIELVGSLVGSWIRRVTPRGALLSALAGIAITFISMGFVFRMFANPLLAILPAFLIVCGYAGRLQSPFRLPHGFFALGTGCVIAWGSLLMGFDLFTAGTFPLSFGLYLPSLFISDIVATLRTDEWIQFLAVIIPMGLFNVIGSLQNLESAEAAGDSYPTASSLAVNGIGTILAAGCGSPFPTTIYIGHPGWKTMGARWSYSLIAGVIVTALTLSGSILLILNVIPLELMLGILLWIGVVITAQAFADVPKHHYPGVVVGLIPCFAAWALLLIESTLRVTATPIKAAILPLQANDIFLSGILSLQQGFILTAMIFSAIVITTIEQKPRQALTWCLTAGLLAWLGVIHSYSLTDLGIQASYGWGAAPEEALAYCLLGGILYGLISYTVYSQRNTL